MLGKAKKNNTVSWPKADIKFWGKSGLKILVQATK